MTYYISAAENIADYVISDIGSPMSIGIDCVPASATSGTNASVHATDCSTADVD